MRSEPSQTGNPLEFIRGCVKDLKVFWTYHVNLRLRDRHIPRQAILESVENYEIIEEYREDKYFPSYLVYSSYKELPVHQCEGCSEYLLDDSVMRRVDEILEKVDPAAELEIIKYAA